MLQDDAAIKAFLRFVSVVASLTRAPAALVTGCWKCPGHRSDRRACGRRRGSRRKRCRKGARRRRAAAPGDVVGSSCRILTHERLDVRRFDEALGIVRPPSWRAEEARREGRVPIHDRMRGRIGSIVCAAPTRRHYSDRCRCGCRSRRRYTSRPRRLLRRATRRPLTSYDIRTSSTFLLRRDAPEGVVRERRREDRRAAAFGGDLRRRADASVEGLPGGVYVVS